MCLIYTHTYTNIPTHTHMHPQDAYTVKVSWQESDSLNGVFQAYQVLASRNISGQSMQVVYNSTDKFLFTTLTNLTAGTQYYISVAVSDVHSVLR